VWQGQSPWDEKAYALNVRFRFQFPKPNRPEDTFLENEEPLVSVSLEPGKDIASHRHFSSADNFGPSIDIDHLEIGTKVAKRIRRMEIAVTLVKVIEWEEIEFKNVREGENELLDCGPFELACTGQKKSLLVSAAAFSSFEEKQEAYGVRVPLKFVNHRFAIEHIFVNDAAGHALFSHFGMGTGGSTNTSFAIPEKDAGHLPELDKRTDYPIGIHGSFESGAEITYPVTITVRLPKRYEKERVLFRIDELVVPLVAKLGAS
jgi:hypothetical protein